LSFCVFLVVFLLFPLLLLFVFLVCYCVVPCSCYMFICLCSLLFIALFHVNFMCFSACLRFYCLFVFVCVVCYCVVPCLFLSVCFFLCLLCFSMVVLMFFSVFFQCFLPRCFLLMFLLFLVSYVSLLFYSPATVRGLRLRRSARVASGGGGRPVTSLSVCLSVYAPPVFVEKRQQTHLKNQKHIRKTKNMWRKQQGRTNARKHRET